MLVTGLTDAPLEGVVAACDLAESLGAAIDGGGRETAQLAGPTIARCGEVTAAWEELRDRADLVLFWFQDPTPSHPRFLERFVTPPLSTRGATRHTIAIGPAAVLATSSTHSHQPLPVDDRIDLARLLLAALQGRAPHAAAPVLVAAVDALRTAIATATCVGIVTAADDRLGTARWSVVELVRALSHLCPAFEIPLESTAAGPGGAGNEAVLSWRYGAGGAISRAARTNDCHSCPAEDDAARLLDRGEVDCVVAVGRLTDELEVAIQSRGASLQVVRIDSGTAWRGPVGVQVRCCDLLDAEGTLLRTDGRTVHLRGTSLPGRGDSLRTLLDDLCCRLSRPEAKRLRLRGGDGL